MSELLSAALHYAAIGWHVFPVQPAIIGNPDSGKRPVGQLVPNGKLNATTDPNIIREWWSHGEWNIGIACEPSKLVVLDVDIGLKKDGTRKQGAASVAAIDSQLTPTLQAQTGSGGFHAYYARPDDFSTGSKIGFADGLDLISNGYIIAAPSSHHSGGRYQWINQQTISPLPTLLRGVARATQTAASTIRPEAAGSPIAEGGRNNALFRHGAALYGATVMSKDALLAALWIENQARFTPPLSEEEVKQITNSVLQRVVPQRDAAMGAVIQQEMLDMFGHGQQPEDTHQPIISDVAVASDLIHELLEQSRLPVVHLPYTQLDQKLDGLQLHSNTLLIAGTGKGKSSLAANITLHHASSGQGPAVYYVGEMTRVLVLARFIGVKLGRSWVDVLRGKVAREDMEKAMHGMPIYFVKRSPDPLKAIIEALKVAQAAGTWTETNVPLIVIDFIQLLASVGADMRISTLQAVREVREFIEAAPVVGLTLSQSSRSGSKQMRDGAQDAEEMVGMGAETAELEQSCTNQLVLSFKSKDDVVEHDVTMMVAKSRFGGGSKLGFIFNGATGLWTPTDKPPVDPKHQKRCDELLHHIVMHAAGKCGLNGMFCGAKLNKAAFRDKARPHWVDGNPAQQAQSLEDLEELKLVRCEGGIYFPPNKPGGSGV